jgi:hypothetical protein
MCSYKTLHRNEEWYIVYCQNCERMHISFGTTVLLKSVDAFYEFDTQIKQFYKNGQANVQHNLRTLLISTLLDVVATRYSLSDFKKPKRLLSNAKEKLTLEKLFTFYDN